MQLKGIREVDSATVPHTCRLYKTPNAFASNSIYKGILKATKLTEASLVNVQSPFNDHVQCILSHLLKN